MIFFSKTKKNIFPTFATLQTQERLVKNLISFFLVEHITQNFFSLLIVLTKTKERSFSGMNFAYELWLFFSKKKNNKNISPNFATLQTQERLVKNQVLFLVGHNTQFFSFYLLCWPKQKKEVPSGIGTVAFMSGEAEAIRRPLSVPSSFNSNWPSSSSARKSSKSIRKCQKPLYLPILWGENEEWTLFGHGFIFFLATVTTHGRTLL